MHHPIHIIVIQKTNRKEIANHELKLVKDRKCSKPLIDEILFYFLMKKELNLSSFVK